MATIDTITTADDDDDDDDDDERESARDALYLSLRQRFTQEGLRAAALRETAEQFEETPEGVTKK